VYNKAIILMLENKFAVSRSCKNMKQQERTKKTTTTSWKQKSVKLHKNN